MGGDEYPRMGRGARQGKLDKQAATRNPELPTQDEASEASQVRQNSYDEQSKIHIEAKQGKARQGKLGKSAATRNPGSIRSLGKARQVGGDENSNISRARQGNIRKSAATRYPECTGKHGEARQGKAS